MRTRHWYTPPYWARPVIPDDDVSITTIRTTSSTQPEHEISKLKTSKELEPMTTAFAEDAERTQVGFKSPFLTTKEAARYLRMSHRTLERLRFEGTGPHYRKAGDGKRAKVLYLAADLDRWISKAYGSTSEYS